MKIFLYPILLSLSLVASANSRYDVSPSMIDSAYQRSLYYTEAKTIPITPDEFERTDKRIPVVVHLHGCSGIYPGDYQLRDFYKSLGYNVIMMDFFKRGDAQTSCPEGVPSRFGHPEVVNPYRQQARLLELESQLSWLRNRGFNTIIVTGYSEGGKTVQQLQSKVSAVIVHAMDCKSREFWNPNKENKYLFLYSSRDPWVTANGGTPAISCNNFFSRNENVVEKISDITNHQPLGDDRWKQDIVNFLNTK